MPAPFPLLCVYYSLCFTASTLMYFCFFLCTTLIFLHCSPTFSAFCCRHGIHAHFILLWSSFLFVTDGSRSVSSLSFFLFSFHSFFLSFFLSSFHSFFLSFFLFFFLIFFFFSFSLSFKLPQNHSYSFQNVLLSLKLNITSIQAILFRSRSRRSHKFFSYPHMISTSYYVDACQFPSSLYAPSRVALVL